MDERDKKALRILRDALDTDLGERAAFVSARCGDDAPLRARVQQMLDRTADADADAPAATADGGTRGDALTGTTLGAFRIGERLGRGGMGVVYRGTRESADFAQTVAIKLIRRGFDFDDVHARFLRERRILARLAHPNLARFIDGGVAADGRPWFALEFVDGEPITRWCDARRLDPRKRVALFLDVCAAVQYAHSQFVVHRDLKPANILVDAAGRVRLLDFGIAGLLAGDDEGDRAPLTVDGRLRAMTPEYAAPEQFGGDDAGAATDVYALGVVLYELLAGVLPYALPRLDAAASERIVRETRPQPLTQAITRPQPTSGATATDEAGVRLAARASSLRGFRKHVRGDLGRIVDKALAKEPLHRYASVQAFADDLGRWLAGAPVRVSGRRWRYRVGKFVGRNRVAVAFAALAVVAMLAGLVGMAWQVRETQRQRDAAELEAQRANGVRDYVMLMFGDARERGGGAQQSVHDVFQQGTQRLFDLYKGRPDLGRNVALMLSELYIQLGDYEGAQPLLQRLLAWPGIEDQPDLLASARFNLAQVEFELGDAARARALLEQAQAAWSTSPARDAMHLNISRALQARIETAENEPDRAIATLDAAIAERRRLLSAPDSELATTISTLAVALLTAGRFDEALARANESVAAFESLGLARSPGWLAAMNNRAAAEARLGQTDRAIADFRQLVAQRRELFGATSDLADSLNNLAMMLTRSGEQAESVPLLEEALQIAITKGDEHGRAAFAARRNLADAYIALGRIDEASGLAETSVAIGTDQFGADSVFAGAARTTRARLRLAQGRKADARADLDEATRIFTAMGDGGRVYLQTLAPLREQLGSR